MSCYKCVKWISYFSYNVSSSVMMLVELPTCPHSPSGMLCHPLPQIPFIHPSPAYENALSYLLSCQIDPSLSLQSKGKAVLLNHFQTNPIWFHSLLKPFGVWNELHCLTAAFATFVIILCSFSESKSLKHPYLSSSFREEFLSQHTQSKEGDKRKETYKGPEKSQI